MQANKFKGKFENLYSKILSNKLITICILFTIFTLLDTIPILLGLWPAKTGIGPYAHLLARFVLHSILISGLFFFDILRKTIKSKLIIYAITFIITWALLLIYLWINGIFIELHPDAFKDLSRSYAFMYGLLGAVIFIGGRTKRLVKNKN
ncbi:DUF6608 family protein [Senegalia massiliensis]|uniref:Uncharacterized protein n=1 Tax=Senegalia massiliensis TaxID=1720316 RepID=A0A845QR34_9CLOT|nr:DUF6608 family protein [Senegalia massiliensis]NBI05237.1 hypothetical protein [Senegalia massiliensis]